MPDISTYLTKIREAVYGEEVRGSIHDAIQAINTEVDNSEQEALKTSLAVNYSSSSRYNVGDYVFHPDSTDEGTLYRCITPITVGEAWNSAHWKAVTLSEDASVLRGAIQQINEFGFGMDEVIKNTYIINSTGAENAYTGWKASGFIKIPEYFEGKLTITASVSETNDGRWNAFYNSSRQYISGFEFVNGTNEITIPDNAVYFRLSGPNAVFDSIVIESLPKKAIDNVYKKLNDASSVEFLSIIDRVEDNMGSNPHPTLIPGNNIQANRTIEGYKLLSTGSCVQDSNCKLLVYQLVTWDIYVEIENAVNSYTWQYQSTNQVPDTASNPFVVGFSHEKGHSGYLKVPKGGSFLVICVGINSAQPIVKAAHVTDPSYNPAEEYYYPTIASMGWIDPTDGHFVNDASSYWIRTDYIPIPVNENSYWEYSYNGSVSIDWSYFAYYDKDKNFITNMESLKNWVPFGAAYMALSASTVVLTKFGIKQTISSKNNIKESVDKIALDDMEIYGNYYNPDTKHEACWLGDNGNISPNHSGYFVTDYIRVPYVYKGIKARYAIACSLKNDVWGANARQIAFYDEHAAFISMWARPGSEQSIQTMPTNVEFIRVCFEEANSYYYMVTFNTNDNLPSYDMYEPKMHGKYLPGTYNSIINSDSSVTSLIITALDYLYHPEIHYGSNHTLFDDVSGGKFPPSSWRPDAYEGLAYQIDCSSFVEACIKGIRFDNSRYLSTNLRNIEAPNAFRFDQQINYENIYDDGVHPGRFERVYANEFAEYAYKKGYLYRVSRDFSNVMPGDILFVAYNHDEETEWESITNFRGIGHVAIVIQKYQRKDGMYQLKIAEAGVFSEWSGPARHIVFPSDSTQWTWAARFPLPDCYFNFQVISGSFTPTRIDFDLTSTTERVEVLSLPLVKPLRNKMVYTLMFEGEYEDDIWFEYWIGDHDNYTRSEYNIGSSHSDLLMRPDRFHTVHIELTMDISINDPTRFCICLRKIPETPRTVGHVIITNAKLYEGYLTGICMG